MKLAELLQGLPDEAVALLSDFLFPMEPKNRDKAETLDKVLNTLSSQDYMKRRYEGMKPWMQQAFTAAVRTYGGHSFELSELQRRLLEEGCSGAHVKAALLACQRYGLLFALKKSWGEVIYQVPEDLLGTWHSILFKSSLVEAGQDAWITGEPIGKNGNAVYELLYLLNFLRHTPLKASKDGVWSKTMLKKLSEGMLVEEEDLVPSGIQVIEPKSCGVAPAAVMEFSYRLALARLEEGYWTLNKEQLEGWLQQSLGQAQCQLVRLWLKLIPPLEPWEQHIWTAIEQAEPNRWYMLDQLFEWAKDCGMIQGIDNTFKVQFLKHRLQPMAAFGWIRLLKLQGEDIAFQLPQSLDGRGNSSDREPPIVVQSDLEIMIPPGAPLSLIWDIMLWCEPVNREDWLVYRLSRNGLRRAAELGYSLESITTTLQDAQGHPLHSSIVETIKAWTGGFRGELYKDVTLLRLRDAAVEPLAEQLGTRLQKLSSGIYLVNDQDSTQLQQDLEKLGVPILSYTSTSTSTEDKTKASSDKRQVWKGALLAPAAVPYKPIYMASTRLVEERWSTIPAVWRSSLGAYHSSTQKEIARRAIDGKAGLRLACEGQEPYDIVPLVVQEEGERWSLEGYLAGTGDRVTIPSDQWTRIQLVIPEGLEDSS